MADDVDVANNIRDEMEADRVAAIRRRAAEMPKGGPGIVMGAVNTLHALWAGTALGAGTKGVAHAE